jgi:hypothetical protein
MEWKIIGLSALFNAVLTVILSLIFFPLSLLGPLTGGFLVSYLGRGYEEYYDKMDEKDGAVLGAISGLIGGLIVGLLFILGFGGISAVIGLISFKLGTIAGSNIILGYILIELSVVVSCVLGSVGGIIGVIVKK